MQFKISNPQINKFFTKSSPWFNLDDYEDIDDLDLLFMAITIQFFKLKLDDFMIELRLFSGHESITDNEVQERLKRLAKKRLLAFNGQSVNLSSDTLFIFIKITANRPHSEDIHSIIFNEFDLENELIFCTRALLRDSYHSFYIPPELYSGMITFLRSDLLFKESIRKDMINEFCKIFPIMIKEGLINNQHSIIEHVLKKRVLSFIEQCTKLIHYDFHSDLWLASENFEDLTFLAEPISGEYLKQSVNWFDDMGYYSSSTLLDIFIKKVINIKDTKKLGIIFDNKKSSINYAFDYNFLLLMEKLIKAETYDLTNMFYQRELQQIFFGQDMGQPTPSYFLITLLMLAFFPISHEKRMDEFKNALLEQDYVKQILQNTYKIPIEIIAKRLLHQILNVPTELPPFFKTVNASEIFIGNLSQIINKKNQPSKEFQQTRLIWVLDERLYLIPKIQKEGKKGWSTGSKLSLKNLTDDHYMKQHPISDEENKLIDLVKPNLNAIAHDILSLDKRLFKQLRELKNVFNHEGEPIKFVDLSKLVVIEQKNSTYQFSIYPTEEVQLNRFSNYEVTLYEIGPNLFGYENFDEITKETIEHLKQSHRLNFKQKEQVLELISPLVNYYDESVGDGNVQVVQWEPKIHAWIKTQASHFMIELTFNDERLNTTIPSFNSSPWIELKDKKWCKRDIAKEQMQLLDIFKALNIPQECLKNVCFTFKIDLMTEVIETLAQFEEVQLHWYNSNNQVKFISEKDFRIKINEDNGWFHVQGEVDIDGREFLEIQKLFDARKKGFITLNQSNIQLVLSKALKDKINLLESVLGENSTIETKLAYPLQQLLSSMTVESDDTWNNLAKKWHEPLVIEESLFNNLREYQQESVKWAIHLLTHGFGACLADDMGLGKTIQALKVISYFSHQGPTLVIAPKSVLYNWQEEAYKFTDGLKPIIFDDNKDKSSLFDSLTSNDLLIMGFSQVNLWQEALGKVQWQTVVLDEAQNIKNHTTKRAQAVFELNAKGRLILSGTPIENDLVELWSLFTFINPGLLGPLEHFKRKYSTVQKNQSDLDKLRAVVGPFVLRRLKTDVLAELPEKIEINHHIYLEDNERKLYEVIRQNALSNAKKNPIELLSALTRLRQVCCDPYLVFNEKKGISSKLQEALRIIEEALSNGRKILIFSQFVGLLERLGHFLEVERISYSLLTGQSTLKQRNQAVEDFKKGETSLFLISLKAGGTGLNLTEADTVIHLDPWWNPAIEDQASDRAHRMGQTQVVTVYRLVTVDTIEEKILQLHGQKRDLAQKVLSGQDETQKLSPELLVSLLHK
ncbi:DEAD/DEAH box helicase [Thorsellia kenyensis]|uniref:DEAD/DEAH box helicase n=1 Tax=Thorsellia kenyensis TaxID=1549888 RepID=A0ABV6CD46_9GAMM